MITEPPIVYPFPDDPSALDYRLFPEELEEDPKVFFHGTKDSVRKLILDNGFKIFPFPRLQSVSFGKISTTALQAASDKTGRFAEAACIFAVRYEKIEPPKQKLETSVLYDFVVDPQPVIIGYCIVPKGYDFL